MPVAFPANLLNHIVEAESNQCPARNPRKPAANLITQLDAAPCDEQTEGGGEQDMPQSGQRCDGQSSRFAPLLHPRREHERQPVRRDGSMEESDGESGRGDGGKYFRVHGWTIPPPPISKQGLSFSGATVILGLHEKAQSFP